MNVVSPALPEEVQRLGSCFEPQHFCTNWFRNAGQVCTWPQPIGCSTNRAILLKYEPWKPFGEFWPPVLTFAWTRAVNILTITDHRHAHPDDCNPATITSILVLPCIQAAHVQAPYKYFASWCLLPRVSTAWDDVRPCVLRYCRERSMWDLQDYRTDFRQLCSFPCKTTWVRARCSVLC